MQIMNAGAVPAGTTLANVAHGLSLTVMKKGMESQEQLATQMIQKMILVMDVKGPGTL